MVISRIVVGLSTRLTVGWTNLLTIRGMSHPSNQQITFVGLSNVDFLKTFRQHPYILRPAQGLYPYPIWNSSSWCIPLIYCSFNTCFPLVGFAFFFDTFSKTNHDICGCFRDTCSNFETTGNVYWLVVASGRTRRLVISCVFCVKWVRWGVGGWVGGMLTFIGLAHLRDATLLHVLFNLHNYVMLRYCTFSSINTTTWCYVDWGGGVGGWVGGGRC